MDALLDSISTDQRSEHPEFGAGDIVRVHQRVIEGEKERVQIFEGVCLRRQGNGMSATFTVRKMSFGIGVERVFPTHGPSIDKVEVKSNHRVRRAKLYYLRDRTGKSARLKEIRR